MSNLVLVSYFPKKREFFGPTIIPSSFEELDKYCAPLAGRWFPAEEDSAILERAFHYFNFDIADESIPMPPPSVKAAAEEFKCMLYATAGSVFSITDSISTRYYYCADIDWIQIVMPD